MSIFTADETANFISNINFEKIERIVILIKKNKAFYTKLENFQHSKTTSLLVGIFDEKLTNYLHNDILAKFDAVFYYKEDLENANNHFGFERELGKNVQKNVEIFATKCCAEKIRIIVTEDSLLYGAAILREKYKIPGPKSFELAQFYDKAMMKEMISAANIPTAKYMVLDLEMPLEMVLEKIEEFSNLAQFPMFRKPTQGDGSVDSGRIESKLELQKWAIERHGHKGLWKKFIVEEFVEGREFWVSVFLLPNGKILPHMIVHFGYPKNARDVPTNTGLPIKSICRRFEDFEEEFPKMFEFVLKVIYALKPMSPNNFVVQGFQLKPNTDLYIFTESAYRQGGPSTGMSYEATGISTESAILSMLFDDNPNIMADPKAMLCFPAQIRWPSWAGTLLCIDDVPKELPHRSSFTMKWNYRPNDRIEKAIYTTDYVALANIANKDKQKIILDVDYLSDNWKPNVQ